MLYPLSGFVLIRFMSKKKRLLSKCFGGCLKNFFFDFLGIYVVSFFRLNVCLLKISRQRYLCNFSSMLDFYSIAFTKIIFFKGVFIPDKMKTYKFFCYITFFTIPKNSFLKMLFSGFYLFLSVNLSC